MDRINFLYKIPYELERSVASYGHGAFGDPFSIADMPLKEVIEYAVEILYVIFSRYPMRHKY